MLPDFYKITWLISVFRNSSTTCSEENNLWIRPWVYNTNQTGIYRYIYGGASLIRTSLIRMFHYPDDITGNKLYENLSNVIHLSGRFVYPYDFAGNQSVRINEARLY
jgi:hypothetical protein